MPKLLVSNSLLAGAFAGFSLLSACGGGEEDTSGDGDGDRDADVGDGDGDGDGVVGDGDGDESGTGGAGEPVESCATCTTGEFCIEVTGHFGNPHEEICVELPSGCELEQLCDCGIELIEGVAINGCINTNPPYHHGEGISCGGAPCGEGELCLYEDKIGGAAECVPTVEGCPIDDNFCVGNCDDEIAGAHGKVASWCDDFLGYVGVGYDPAE